MNHMADELDAADAMLANGRAVPVVVVPAEALRKSRLNRLGRDDEEEVLVAAD